MPLETGTTSVFDPEPGYRIARRDYALPDITWSRTRPRRSASRPGCGSTPAWPRPPRRGCSSCAPPGSTSTRRPPSGWSRWSPSTRRSARCRPRPASRQVRFDYRTPGPRPAASPPAAAVGRGLLARPVVRRRATTSTGRRPAASGCPGWSARCGGRRAGAFTPPARHRPDQRPVAGGPAPSTAHRAARVVRPGRAAGIRRCAESVTAGPDGDELVIDYSDPDGFARWIVGYGPDVVVLEPDAAARRRAGGDPASTGRSAASRDAGWARWHERSVSARRQRPAGRLLNLVPYLLARPGHPVAEAAADLGASPTGSCARTWSCSGCAGCPATARAT